MRAVNLLPPGERRDARKLPIRGLAAGTAGVAILGAMGMLYTSTTAATQQATSEAETLQADLATVQTQTNGLRRAQAQVALLRTRVTLVQNLAADRADWERVFRRLATTVPDGDEIMTVEAVTPQVGAGAAGAASAATAAPGAGPADLTITGRAATMERVAEMITRVKAIPDLTRVALIEAGIEQAAQTPGAVTSGARAGSVYKWTVTAALRGADVAAAAADAAAAAAAAAPAETPAGSTGSTPSATAAP